MVLRKLNSHMQKNETWPLPYTIHKKSTQNGLDLNIRPEIIKFLEDNIGGNSLT